MRSLTRLLSVLGLLAAAVPVAFAHTAGEELSSAASALSSARSTPSRRPRRPSSFDDAERTNWIFVPAARKGLPLKEMNPGQRHFAQAILSVALSGRGHMKAEQIMALEQLLLETRERLGPEARRRELLRVHLRSRRKLKGTWGFRWEGHHLSLNFTLVDGELVSSTPSFFASNPGKIKDDQPGPVGFELLKYEDDLGRQLAKSLTA